MNAQDLKAKAQLFLANQETMGITVHAVLKNDTEHTPYQLDIEQAALNGLKALFLNQINEIICLQEELFVVTYSTADERANAIYQYDLELPEAFRTFEVVSSSVNSTKLDLTQNSLSSIDYFIIEIGDNQSQVQLYKKIAPVNVYGRDSFFIKKDATRMKQIEEEFLRISSNFQAMRISNKVLILDLKAIEKTFGFHDIIKKEGKKGIDEIENMNLVENISELRPMLEEVRYAKKFARISENSPVRDANIPNDSIISFCKTFPTLKGKFKFNDADDKIILKTKIAKELFVRLMMDDFLTSGLTKYHYESLAKDRAKEAEA